MADTVHPFLAGAKRQPKLQASVGWEMLDNKKTVVVEFESEGQTHELASTLHDGDTRLEVTIGEPGAITLLFNNRLHYRAGISATDPAAATKIVLEMLKSTPVMLVKLLDTKASVETRAVFRRHRILPGKETHVGHYEQSA